VSGICRRWILENAVILPDLLQSCFKAVLKLFQSVNKPARRKSTLFMEIVVKQHPQQMQEDSNSGFNIQQTKIRIGSFEK
jgi:hypothetical protein